MLVHSYI